MEHWDFDDIVTEFICKDGRVRVSTFKQPTGNSLPGMKFGAIDPDGYFYDYSIFDMANMI